MDSPATEHHTTNRTMPTAGQSLVLTIPYQIGVTLNDASWDVQKNASWGMVMYLHNGELHKVEFGLCEGRGPIPRRGIGLVTDTKTTPGNATSTT